MTVGITIYPDGMGQLPTMARNSEILALYLSNSGYENWKNVVRQPSQDSLKLFLGGDNATMEDFAEADLTAISDSIINNINGLVASPFGWRVVDGP